MNVQRDRGGSLSIFCPTLTDTSRLSPLHAATMTHFVLARDSDSGENLCRPRDKILPTLKPCFIVCLLSGNVEGISGVTERRETWVENVCATATFVEWDKGIQTET